MKKTFLLLFALVCCMAVNATELYLVGTATPAVWKTGYIRKQTQLIETSEGSNVFVWEGNLPGNPNYTSGMAQYRFKIVNSISGWAGYRAESQYTDITNKTGAIIERPVDSSSYPDNFWFVMASGKYKITVDLNENTISCMAVEDGPVTAIGEIAVETVNTKVFNLKGQELAKPVKGVNIINGKKVLVK